MELNEDNSSNINDLDHNSNPSHLEDLKSNGGTRQKQIARESYIKGMILVDEDV